jgi:hypothetical protein
MGESAYFLLFLMGLGFELRTLHLQSRHSGLQSILLWLFFFQAGEVFQTVFVGWPQTVIPLVLSLPHS